MAFSTSAPDAACSFAIGTAITIPLVDPRDKLASESFKQHQNIGTHLSKMPQILKRLLTGISYNFCQKTN